MLRRISLWRRDRCRGGVRFVVLGLIEAAITLHAQPPAILWTRLYNAPGIEVPQGIAEMADGGFAICSYQFDSTNNIEALIRRVSSNGIVEWTYPFGGPFPYPCAAQAIIETSDGNLLTVGRYDTSEVMGVFALKLTFAGQPVWARFFLGTEFNTGVAVVETEDGGYAIAGIQAFDVPLHIDGRLLKLDYDGNLLWTGYVSQGPNTRIDIADLVLTPDGNYLLYGTAFPLFTGGPHRLLLTKMNNIGDTLWTRIWENPNWDLSARNLVAVPEGGYLLSAAVDDENYPWLLRLDENGDTLWTRRLDEGYPPSLRYVIVDKVGSDGFVLSGETLAGNIWRSYVARLDASGNRRWSTTISHDPDWFGPRAIIGCQTGGYALLVGFPTRIRLSVPSFVLALIL